MILCVFLCSPDFSNGNVKYGPLATLSIITFVVAFCLLTLLPLSKEYKLSFSNRQFTYQKICPLFQIFF